MKKIILLLVFNLLMCGFAFAQTPFAELDKVREIRLLESNRKDVKRILADYEHDKDEDDDYTQSFSTENVDVEITFSNGETCGEEDSEKVWNVSELKVIRIEISPNIPIRFEDLGISPSDFRKEQKYADNEDLYVYHNKDLGIAYEVDEDEIETIFLFPTTSNYSLLCDNETAEEYQAFYTNESFFTEPDLEKRKGVISCPVASVTSLTLSAKEIIIGCNDSAENKSCSDSSMEISIKTVGNDTENDPLTYHYTVSGGTITGNGAEVIWDLTGVELGTYTITAGVDDGCGICGATRTETVVVKECSDCAKEKLPTDTKKP